MNGGPPPAIAKPAREGGLDRLRSARRLSFTLVFTLVSGAAGAAAADTPFPAELAPPPSAEALAKIPDFGRKLLALRSYLRAGSRLPDRWSWSAAQIAAFEKTPEHEALAAEVAAVGAHFAACNHGYTLYVHAKVRSLDVQIEHWNSNESVGVAAGEIGEAWAAKFGAQDGAADKNELAEMQRWLVSFKGSRQANIAAPGLSLHGRARAIDFQIQSGGKIVAAADSRQIEPVWRAEQWDRRLLASVVAAGPSFFGPLTSPDEPWHFDYDPARRPADRTEAVSLPDDTPGCVAANGKT